MELILTRLAKRLPGHSRREPDFFCPVPTPHESRVTKAIASACPAEIVSLILAPGIRLSPYRLPLRTQARLRRGRSDSPEQASKPLLPPDELPRSCRKPLVAQQQSPA